MALFVLDNRHLKLQLKITLIILVGSLYMKVKLTVNESSSPFHLCCS